MQSIMLKSKIHHARVTQVELEYEGSLTIDEELMELVNILPYEKVLVGNLENGNRFETYAIPGPRGTGVMCLNGATAHLGKVGDRITILTFGVVSPEKAPDHLPLIARLGENNKPIKGLHRI